MKIRQYFCYFHPALAHKSRSLILLVYRGAELIFDNKSLLDCLSVDVELSEFSAIVSEVC